MGEAAPTPRESGVQGAAEPHVDGPGRYCRDCLYDLGGRAGLEPRCPECGRAFDPDDPSTTLDVPRRPTHRLLGVAAWTTLCCLLVYAGVAYNILPRPLAIDEWRVWLWMDRAYGLERSGPGTGTRFLDRHWWNGRVTRVESWERSNPATPRTLRWRVSRIGPDQFEIEVPATGIEHGDVRWGLNVVCQDEFLGVYLEPGPIVVNDAAFTVRGSKAEVLSEVVSRYQIRVVPFLESESQTHVWIFNHQTQLLERVGVDKARSLGFGPLSLRPGAREQFLRERRNEQRPR